jgi:hypothetical protein
MGKKGFHNKYIVLRKDGEPADGIFFVLKPQSDVAARVAIRAYADACMDTRPELAVDLLLWLRRISVGKE